MRISILWLSLSILFCGMFCGLADGQEADTQTGDQSGFRSGETHLIPVTLPPVTPTKLDRDQAKIKLPGVFTHVAAGGNGRYLIFYLKQQKQLAVFDVSAAQIIKLIPIEFEDISLTAGADKLVILSRDQSVIQRYSLNTFEKELSLPVALNGEGSQLVMGSASNGPVLFFSGNESYAEKSFLDLQTLEKSRVDLPGGEIHVLSGNRIIHVSPDGKVFGICVGGIAPSRIKTIRINGNQIETAHRYDTNGVVVPGKDGSRLFNASGIYLPSLRQIAGEVCLNSGIPAVYSDYYFVRGEDGSSFHLHRGDQAHPLATVSAPGPQILPEVKDARGRTNGAVKKEAEPFLRHYFIEQAQVLITLPESNDEILLQHLDLKQTLEQTDQNYLFVSSEPILEATREERYTYPIQVKSKQEQVRFQLYSGPEGMTISSRGVLEWNVPPDFRDSRVNVFVNIIDATGYELFHEFEIAVSGDQAMIAEIPKIVPEPVVSQPAPASRNATSQGMKGALAILKSAGQSKPEPPEPPQSKPIDTLKPGQRKVDLPAPLTDMVAGRSGQYLILYFQSLKQLKVFDVASLKFIKTLPAGSEDILFAASAEYLIVVLRDQQIIERWKLDDFKRDLVVPVPVDKQIHAVVMGHSSSNLLVLFSGRDANGQNYTYVDPRSMKVIEVKGKDSGYLNSSPILLKAVSASADGRVVTLGNHTLIYLDSNIEYRQSPRDYGSLLLPGADGTFLYSERGIITNQMEEIFQAAEVGKPVLPIQLGSLIPAIQPGYFLNLLSSSRRDSGQIDMLAVHAVGELQPLLTLNDVDTSLSKFERQDPPGMAYAKRFSFFPDQNLLIQVPNSNDRLILHRVSLLEQMKQSGIDYFYATSRPETKAAPGQLWKYQIETASRKGGVKYELKSGPEGMTVTDTGLMSWKVPADVVEPEFKVTVQLKDDSTQELNHRFTMFVPAAIGIAQEKVRREEERKEAEKKMVEDLKAAAQEAKRIVEREKQNSIKLQRLVESGKTFREQAEQDTAEQFRRFEKEQALRKLRGFGPDAPNPYRLWTDISENEIEARLIKYFADTVILHSRSNQILTIPDNTLSALDREYLNQVSKTEIAERKQREKELADSGSPQQRMLELWLAIQKTPSRFGKTNLLGNIQDQQGKPLLSWRVQLLKYVGQGELYSLFRHDEPWDSEYNKKLIPLIPSFYRSSRSKAGVGKTNLLAIRAQRPLFSGPGGESLFRGGELPGKTAIVVEAPDALAVEWTKPDDWEYESDNSIERLFGFQPDGFYALFADGKVELISDKKPLDEIGRMLNLENGPTNMSQ
ncbi:MAG: DUF1559 domain-containing protein [Planctomycetaceae bacterium]|nr:DUF1559 domain-containing protein [Planctomycetaceae bacterium]